MYPPRLTTVIDTRLITVIRRKVSTWKARLTWIAAHISRFYEEAVVLAPQGKDRLCQIVFDAEWKMKE